MMRFFKRKISPIVPPTIENEETRKTLFQQCCSKEALKEQMLLIATIIAVVLGVVIGIALRPLKCPRGKEKKRFFFLFEFRF